MNIIGINAWHADASAALVVDGKLILAIEEERFTRKKHWAGFPSQAIQFCLKESGLNPEDIDFFVIGRDPSAKFLHKILYLVKNPGGSFRAIKDRFANSRKAGNVTKELVNSVGKPESFFKNKVVHVEHHRSHIASAFFASPFEEAACLSVDGSGDFSTTMTGIGRDNRIEILNSVDFPHSLGIFYTAFTQLLGFPHYGDEYKVMGLAPYGKPVYAEEVSRIIKLRNDGLFRLDLSFFRKGTEGIISYDENFMPVVAPLYSQKMIDTFGKVRDVKAPLTQANKDLAASVQQVTEQVLFHILNYLCEITKCKNLCLAGGVAQNSVANGKIRDNTPFENIYIPGAGHDAGISMGSALFVHYKNSPSSKRYHIKTAYLGSKYSNEEIKHCLREINLGFSEMNDEELFEKICGTLIKGGVVGWFNGRSEFGPRALGGRSILADPRRSDAKSILNTKIKRRESFRPFAPSVLKEYVSEFFEQDDDVPFMEKVFKIREEKRSLIPAVTHVDGTGRLQTVEKEASPRYYNLIETFRRKTGIPILLNTSFNENEPIVNTLEDAVNCFLRTGMDMLVMENVVVERGEELRMKSEELKIKN
ncbi:MAG: carbamoyltransferase [Chitinophagaceae bacterium]|nr:carbamoyltransferase [Chitinophagaceae bacterium]